MPKADEYPSYIYRKDMMKAFEELGIATEDIRTVIIKNDKVLVICKRRGNDGNYVVVGGVLLSDRIVIEIRDEADRP